MSDADQRLIPPGYRLEDLALINEAHRRENGPIETRVEFNDIEPLSSNVADVQAATNRLLIQALIFLNNAATPNEEFSVTFPPDTEIVTPGDLVRLQPAQTPTRRTEAWVSECTIQAPSTEWSAVLSPFKKIPVKENEPLVRRVVQSVSQRTSQQLTANRDTLIYTDIVGTLSRVSFPVSLLEDSFSIESVRMRMDLLPFTWAVASNTVLNYVFYTKSSDRYYAVSGTGDDVLVRDKPTIAARRTNPEFGPTTMRISDLAYALTSAFPGRYDGNEYNADNPDPDMGGLPETQAVDGWVDITQPALEAARSNGVFWINYWVRYVLRKASNGRTSSVQVTIKILDAIQPAQIFGVLYPTFTAPDFGE